MIRTLILLACAVSLTGCKDFNSGAATVEAFMRGTPDPAAFVETVAVEQPTSVEVVTVAAPEPPHVPDCWWQRFQTYMCDGVEVIPQPHNPYFD